MDYFFSARTAHKLSEANRYLESLMLSLILSLMTFIKMHVTKEATVSSKIEGTQREEASKEEDINPEKRDDWKEYNYMLRC
jgi:Fic family protein